MSKYKKISTRLNTDKRIEQLLPSNKEIAGNVTPDNQKEASIAESWNIGEMPNMKILTCSKQLLEDGDHRMNYETVILVDLATTTQHHYRFMPE